MGGHGKFNVHILEQLAVEPVTWAAGLFESEDVAKEVCSQLGAAQPELTGENIGHIMWFLKTIELLPKWKLHQVMKGNARMSVELCEYVIVVNDETEADMYEQ